MFVRRTGLGSLVAESLIILFSRFAEENPKGMFQVFVEQITDISTNFKLGKAFSLCTLISKESPLVLEFS